MDEPDGALTQIVPGASKTSAPGHPYSGLAKPPARDAILSQTGAIDLTVRPGNSSIAFYLGLISRTGASKGEIGGSKMALRHTFVTACLNMGLSVAKQSDLAAVKRFVSELHPVTTDLPMTRFGSKGDGGYVMPDDLEGVVACFSPGVDNRATFETSMIERGIPCFLADASVEAAPVQGDMVHFTKKYLGVVNDETTVTLDDWVAQHSPGSGDIVLQMDIEGAEWPVLLNASNETLRRCRIMVLELHDMERLMDKHAFTIIRATFQRLLRDFHVVHIHPNNYGGAVRRGAFVIPRAIEITLLRKDRAKPTGYATQFPHPLDQINDQAAPDVVLPEGWRR